MANKKIKVAIAHDSYLYLGGAERVLHTLLDLYPQADVFIPLIKKTFKKKISKNHYLKTSCLNYLPFKKQISSLIKPFILLFWNNLKLTDYDLVISSSHSFSAKSINVDDKTVHVSYIHTPPRYLYAEFNEMSWIKKKPFKTILRPLIKILQKQDLRAAQKPNLLIANSKTVQQRISKYYQRNSTIIHPPVKIKNHIKSDEGEYYVFHSRLVRQKGAELVIKTFNQIGKKIIIIGTGAEELKLKKIARNNIVFLGFVPDIKISKIYNNAKALIYASIEEDFGLVPLESMSFGIPIIGYDSGGIRETVVDGKTGILFKKHTISSLTKAINKFENISKNKEKTLSSISCVKQAQKFSEKNFKKKIKKLINDELSSRVK